MGNRKQRGSELQMERARPSGDSVYVPGRHHWRLRPDAA
jgi:hypothetical protein